MVNLRRRSIPQFQQMRYLSCPTQTIVIAMLKQEGINNWFLNVMNKSIDHTIIQF